MRDALRTDDQESYFRILSGVDLLLPVSADALAGLAPLGWGTWSTGGRTHVLAFTSSAALQACLADYTGSARRVPYAELANSWPNLEWWLAVNPGLPIEGYLPAWFVAQLSRGDLRLPTRGPGREPASSADLRTSASSAGAAALGRSQSGPGGPTHDSDPLGAPSGGAPAPAYGLAGAAASVYGAPPGGGPSAVQGQASGPPAAGYGQPPQPYGRGGGAVAPSEAAGWGSAGYGQPGASMSHGQQA